MDSGLDLLTIDDVSMEENRFHLRLLLHAHICLQQETQTTNNSTNYTTTSQNLCTVPYCKEMRIVLQHMTQCENFDNCSGKFDNLYNNYYQRRLLSFFSVHHCIKSRSIMSHWKNCTTPSCPMCSSTPQVSRKLNKFLYLKLFKYFL